MLQENEIEFEYRDYRKEPLSESELREVLGLLGLRAAQVLRRRDRAFRELGLTGDESEDTLIGHMVDHPTLLERPIGVTSGAAVLGRPPERLLELA